MKWSQMDTMELMYTELRPFNYHPLSSQDSVKVLIQHWEQWRKDAEDRVFSLLKEAKMVYKEVRDLPFTFFPLLFISSFRSLIHHLIALQIFLYARINSIFFHLVFIRSFLPSLSCSPPLPPSHPIYSRCSHSLPMVVFNSLDLHLIIHSLFLQPSTPLLFLITIGLSLKGMLLFLI